MTVHSLDLQLTRKELEALCDVLSYYLQAHSPCDDPSYSTKKDLSDAFCNLIYCNAPWMARSSGGDDDVYPW